jgi:hypothetical protein
MIGGKKRVPIIETDKGIDLRQVESDQLAAAQAERDAKVAATAAELAEQARPNLTLAEVWPIYISARKHKWSAGHLQNHMTLTATGGEPKKRGKGLTVAGPGQCLSTLGSWLPILILSHEPQIASG